MNPAIWLISKHHLTSPGSAGPLPPAATDVAGEAAAPSRSMAKHPARLRPGWAGSDPTRCRVSSGPGWLLSPMLTELSLRPREPWGLWGTALKSCKDQTVYWREWFTFIRQCLWSLGSEGELVVSPGSCYKSYCMSGASQNPTPIIPACWKPPERKKWGRGEEREGEFGLPLVKPDRSSFHLLAEAVQLE